MQCTLSARELEDRLKRIADLNDSALRSTRHDGRRTELTYDTEAAERVREFVRREQQCCGFLKFTVRHERDAVILVIDA